MFLNSGQVTRPTPEMTFRLQTGTPRQLENVCPPTYHLTCNRPNTDVSSVESGFGDLVPSGPENDTLPLGQRGRLCYLKIETNGTNLITFAAFIFDFTF
ncbi:hypothetical protein AVEN_54067-1 [Araneus ventricosus]|uniref:Uncharacterized protein n=1 Tax=Araneus ventricosus TaxID=182803 RepID=A0A4Y2VNR2_ARAVE|nr:hypothetical protein AVEN_54067-1 [Araneus ventricosus]